MSEESPALTRERADALAAFSPAGPQGVLIYGEGLYWCPSCSALVASREQHLDWHTSLQTTIAEKADGWMNRPIA